MDCAGGYTLVLPGDIEEIRKLSQFVKLEHLTNIYKDYPEEDMIRLFHFNPTEAGVLQSILTEKLIKKWESVELESLDFVEPINCHLKLIVSEEDRGIIRKNERDFECYMTIAGYEKMVELMQPFAEKESSGYQWLYDLTVDVTPTEFLFSPGGYW